MWFPSPHSAYTILQFVNPNSNPWLGHGKDMHSPTFFRFGVANADLPW